ncbi:hypothetical protein E3N88_23944 [Mikania micrantha]|uniref:Uncharacterized protein n=1 Tax=Mikania micrantha TaxID=192012 RepID=A0A5N6NGF9_9ASTR|nr:hypothetical protein E3N88_23944 [Mikania micrantha]
MAEIAMLMAEEYERMMKKMMTTDHHDDLESLTASSSSSTSTSSGVWMKMPRLKKLDQKDETAMAVTVTPGVDLIPSSMTGLTVPWVATKMLVAKTPVLRLEPVTTISAVDPDLNCFTDAPDYLKHVDKSQLRIVE